MRPPIKCLLTNLGNGRDVYLLKNGNVLKVDKRYWLDNYGHSQSATEIYTWLHGEAEDLEYLCPLLGWGKLDDGRFWVIMPFADTDHDEFLLEAPALELADNVGHIVEDINTGNIGTLNGKWIVIDYGV